MILLRKYIFRLLLLLVFFSGRLAAQGNMIAISSTVPNQLTVCMPADTFKIRIYNPSPALLTDVLLTAQLPTGVLYELGSISGASEFDVSDLGNPIFSLADLATLSTIDIAFQAAISCDIIAFVAAGNLIQNEIRVDYNTGNLQTYDEHSTAAYAIRQPNLSITSISNQTYSGNTGDVFTRCITISNGGLGSLEEFELTETHGNGIQINNVDVGTWTNTGTNEQILLTGIDFSQIGNRDTLFDSGEQIVICQTVEVINCISVASNYKAKWGCFSQTCQFSESSANVVFPNLTPNLKVTHVATMSSCLGEGNPSVQSLKIENIGQGDALNVALDIFQATGANFSSGLRSRIDENSFTIQFGAGSEDPLAPTSTANNAAYSCLAANPKGRAFLDIPIIPAGETAVIRWNSYSCCWNTCGGGNKSINGWKYTGSYSNICEKDFTIASTLARNDAQLYGDLGNNGSPASMSAGQTEAFSFVFSSYGNSYPAGPGRYWRFDITLPPCVVYAGNMHVLHRNGTSVWSPASVNSVGNQLSATFNGSPPWNLQQAEINFDLSVDCNTCASGGSGNVEVKAYYVPNNNCTCEVLVSCQSSPLSVVCPQTCEGMTMASFITQRTSYGAADNNNDGLADANPSNLDFSLIRRDRAMFGDTLTSEFKAAVNTSTNNPFWLNAYASSSITNGNRISFLDAELIIKRGAQTFTCRDFTPIVNTTGTTRKFEYDLSVATLITEGCVAAGFQYLQGDSVIFKPRYKVSSNPGGVILECDLINEFYFSPIVNPTNTADKFSCNDYRGNFSIVGYYYTNWGPNDYDITACQSITVSQNYYLSIGPCCQNYAGGNFFPFEYRNWAHIQTLEVQAPIGYQYQSARFNHIRTAGSGATNTHPWININPVDPNANRLVFEVEQYHEGYGGTIPLSDDGFHGTIQVTYTPSCAVVPNVKSPMRYYWRFGPSNYLNGSNTANTYNVSTHDYITYLGPDLLLQSTLPSVLAPDRLAEWEISVSNVTSSDALNAWLSAPIASGITIDEVYDLDNNQIIYPSGEIYQIGGVNASSIRNFRIRASYTNCNIASFELHTGWNCNDGYPVDLASYPCNTESITLTLTPQSPTLITNVISPSSSVDLCDTATYIVEGENIQLGTAYDLNLRIVLPVGVQILSGTTVMEYPLTTPEATIPDPTFVSGTIWEWHLSTMNTQLANDGLKGLLNQNLNKVKIVFKVATGCDYISGSLIGFNFKGESACGQTTGQEITLSSQLAISGATEPYFTDIDLITTYISPCSDASEMKVVIVNTGPLDFGPTDSIFIDLPENVSFIANSFSGIHNAPLHSNPFISHTNNRQKIAWSMPQGTTLNDSVVFTFHYEGDAQALSCGISNFDATSVSSNNILCVVSNQPCDIRVVTGTATLPIYTYKANLQFASANASALPLGNNTEQVDFDIALNNFGQSINAGNLSILKYYHDADGSGDYSAGDLYLMSDTITQQILNGTSYQHSSSHVLNSGETCPIIVQIDGQNNPCVCNGTETVINDIPLLNAGLDTAICSGESFEMGFENVNGYTYSWNPSTGLSNPNIANPVFSMQNNSTVPDSFHFVLTTDMGLCISIDSMLVIVNPLPTVSFSGLDPEYCVNEPVATVTGSPLGGFFEGNGISGNSFNPATAGVGPHTIAYTYTDNKGCTDSSQQQIIVRPLPVINVQSFGNICLDAEPLVLTQGSPAGGTYFGTAVNAGSFSPSLAGVGTHTIYYTYTEPTYACSDTSSNTIEVRPLPEISLDTIMHVTCFSLQDGKIYISANNGNTPYSFEWSNGDQTQNLLNEIAGNYYVILTDQYACRDSANYDISQPDSLIGAATALQYPGGNNVSCWNAEDGQVDITTIGGTAPYTYNWSNSDMGIPLANIGAGTYTLSITDINSCIDTLQVTLTEPDTLISSLSALTYIGGNNISCFGATDGEITLSATGGIHPYYFDWSNSETDSIISNLAVGTYQLTISDTNGCETQNSIVLSQPDSLSIDTSISIVHCLNGSDGAIELIPSGGIAPYTYAWSTSESSIGISGLSAGTYTATVTDENGCEKEISIEMADGYQLETEMEAIQVSCNNFADAEAEVSPINGLAPFTYQWSNGELSPRILSLDTGMYSVLVIDANACEAFDTVQITEPDSLLSSISGIYVTCFNGSDGEVFITANGGTEPYTYAWNIAGENAEITGLPIGNYSVTITDANSCRSIQSFEIHQPLDMWVETDSFVYEIALGDEVEIFTNYFANDRSIASYEWTPSDGLDCDNCETTLASPIQETFYSLEITDDRGCKADTNFIVKIKHDKVFYIPTGFSPNGDGINDVFKVYALGVVNFHMQIFDRWGTLVFETRDINDSWDGTYKGQLLESEVYVCHVTADFLDKDYFKRKSSITLLR